MNPNKPRASAAIFEVLKGKVIFCLRYWPFYVIVVTLLVFVACYSRINILLFWLSSHIR